MNDPEEPDIGVFPLWIAVGFAARCARLVYPHFLAGYPKAPKAIRQQVQQAIAIAEQFAAQASGIADYSAEADADLAVDVATAVRRWAADPEVSRYSDAAAAAAYAAGAAADFTAGFPWARRELVSENATRAVCGSLHCAAVAPQVRHELAAIANKLANTPLGDAAPFRLEQLL